MRLTTPCENGYRLNGDPQDVAEKLGRLEDLCEELPAQQLAIHEKMEALRSQGKEKSCQFRELMVQKLNNSMLIATLQARGLMK